MYLDDNDPLVDLKMTWPQFFSVISGQLLIEKTDRSFCTLKLAFCSSALTKLVALMWKRVYLAFQTKRGLDLKKEKRCCKVRSCRSNLIIHVDVNVALDDVK